MSFAFLLLAAALGVASPGPTPSPSPSPSPKSANRYKEIGRVVAHGRNVNLVGKVSAASTGTIDQQQIKTRPVLRPGEILEVIPGLLVSQHSGEGKANQYYLRGFQLDHGTDLESTIASTPINLPTHAHGQGYSDINWLIPELVSYVEYKKGPYYADEGDFSTAGSYDLYYKDTLNSPIAEFGIGTYGYGNFLVADSPRLGVGNLLYAFQIYHDNGPFLAPDEYSKFNGVLRWSRSTLDTNFNVTAMGYRGAFQSTDQIPQRLVTAGELDPYGYIDPFDGGTTYRYALSSRLQHIDAHGQTTYTAFGYQQYLDLFSDFTYFLDDATDYYNVTRNPITCTAGYTTCDPNARHVGSYTSYCPANDVPNAARAPAQSITPNPFTFACGDQREQLDKRYVSGFDITRAFDAASTTTTTAGLGVRNDNISPVELALVHDRVPYANGTLSYAHVVERDAYAWIQTLLRVGPKLQLTGALRADQYHFDVAANSAADSGTVSAGIVSPKFTMSYVLSPNQELYADWGESFHSNDARGLTETIDPQTQAPYDALGQPIEPVSPLVRAVGEELGYRYSNAALTTTLALWQLNLASELIFDGDAGVTFAGGPTVRRGIEFANYYRPLPWLTLDADVATSNARFLTNFNGQGTFVPESIDAVTSAGVTVDNPNYSASLRLRYFGPRVLDQAGDAVSSASVTYSAQGTWKSHRGFDVILDAFNLLDAAGDDVEYYYGSWLPQDAAKPAYAANPAIDPALGGSGVNDYHFHPSEKFTVRLTFVIHPS